MNREEGDCLQISSYIAYNKELLDKLVQKNYITRADEEWIGKEDNKLIRIEKEHVITGYVKLLKE